MRYPSRRRYRWIGAFVFALGSCFGALSGHARAGAVAWQSFGTGVNAEVFALAAWDPDGSSPLAEQFVAGGNFTDAGGVPANRIARWGGRSWQTFGSGMNGAVRALTTWDADGAGPLTGQIVAGGGFTNAGGVAASRIARWDGTAWQALGSGLNSGVYALTTWDPDGAGPLPEELIAGGHFTMSAGAAVNHVARWDGVAWRPLADGVDGDVYALMTWDPDGPGPLPVQLVAAGEFATAGGVVVNNIARWDGVAWQPFGSGMDNWVLTLTTWDPDGAGPLPAQLLSGGHFTAAGGAPRNHIARWDGESWQSVGGGVNGSVYSMTVWDPDGSGPMPAQPLAGGIFFNAGGVGLGNMARWDGTAWQAFGSGMNDWVLALITWDPDGSEPLSEQPVAGGLFTVAGSASAARLATWSTIRPSLCPADFNGSGAVTVQDVFDFLAAYFAMDSDADFNGVGGVSLQDLLDFLAAYLGGCS